MVFRKRQITYSERPTRAARIAHAKGDPLFRQYDVSQVMPKKSKAPVVIAIILLLVIICVVVALFFAFCSSDDAELLTSDETATVVVDEGENAQTIGQTLEDAHLITSSSEFVNRARELGVTTSLVAGSYTFNGGMSVDEILDILQIGPSATGNSITIPEGLTREATASAVDDATGGRITADEFLEASSDASVWADEFSFLTTAGTNSLEGFLYPMTYTVTSADTAVTLVEMMLQEFEYETRAVDWSYPEEAGLDVYQAVTLASIVQKEANSDTTIRQEVASVFYNRLASDYPYLQSDATTAYEVGHEPTSDEVHADTPYSTYTNEGLPPTPICSPDLDAIQAVCNPADTDYMFFYFVTNDDGTQQFYFSETYDEHLAAINGDTDTSTASSETTEKTATEEEAADTEAASKDNTTSTR